MIRSPVVLVLLAFSAGCASDRAPARTGDSARAGEDTPVAASGAATAAATAAEAGRIVVNGQALTEATVRQLQQAYPVAIAPGRYWYDAVSGAYGREGSPIGGQMAAGLSLGGPLRGDASRGTSGVFINGRQLTHGEKSYLELACQTPVAPARYWIMANGLGGYEGGPAFFNLGECPGMRRPSGGRGSSSRTYCDGNGACTTSGILGTITTTP